MSQWKQTNKHCSQEKRELIQVSESSILQNYFQIFPRVLVLKIKLLNTSWEMWNVKRLENLGYDTEHSIDVVGLHFCFIFSGYNPICNPSDVQYNESKLQIYILQVWRNSLLNKGTPIKISRQKKKNQLYIMPHFTPICFLNSFVKGSRIFMYY